MSITERKEDTEMASISEYQLRNKDRMIDALKEFGKPFDSKISKRELLAFLEKNTEKKLSKEIYEKIYSALLENKMEIEVKDFVNNFIGSLGEIRRAEIEYKKRIKAEIQKNDFFREKIEENKKEKMNQNGISMQSIFKIIFGDVEFKDMININKKEFYLLLNFISEGETKETKKTKRFGLNSSNLFEEFSFSPKRKDDSLNIYLFSVEDENESELGNLELSLNAFKSQEDTEVILEIPDNKDNKKINLVVNSKATFLWSFFDYFQEQKNNSDILLEKLREKAIKTSKYFMVMTSFKFMEKIDDGDNIIPVDKDDMSIFPNTKNTSLATNTKSETNDLISILKEENCNMSIIIFYCTIGSLLLSFLCSFNRCDYINVFVMMTILYRNYNSQAYDVIKSFNLILFLVLFSLIYDIFWLILLNDSMFTMVISLLNMVCKISILFSSYINKEIIFS